MSSFDHLVGARDERRGYSNADRLCSLEIDNQFERRGLQDWKITRLIALEDAADVEASFAMDARSTGAVAAETAGQDGFSKGEDCRDGVTDRQGGDLFGSGGKQGVGANDQNSGPTFGHSCKGGVDL